MPGMARNLWGASPHARYQAADASVLPPAAPLALARRTHKLLPQLAAGLGVRVDYPMSIYKRPDSECWWYPQGFKIAQGQGATRGMWVCDQQGYRCLQHMPSHVPLLLCKPHILLGSKEL